MSKVPLDPAPLHVQAVDIGAYRELAAVERATSVRKAKWMVAFERQNAFRSGTFSGAGHFAECNGATAEIGRTELDLGHAMQHYADLETLVLQGRVSVASGAVLGRIVRQGLLREGDDWIAQARSLTTSRLHRLYVERRDEHAAGEAVFTVISRLTPEEVDDVARCRVLLSRREGRIVSPSRTLGLLASDYRRRCDPLRRRPGRRRMPDTHGRSGRHVPAEVDREVRRRTADGCRFPLCDHEIWVDRAHVRPHARRGSREASNLHLLCKRHHRLFDAGCFTIRGTPENPRFFTRDGRPIDGREPFLPGDDAEVAARERRALDELLARARKAPGGGWKPGEAPSVLDEPPPPPSARPAARGDDDEYVP